MRRCTRTAPSAYRSTSAQFAVAHHRQTSSSNNTQFHHFFLICGCSTGVTGQSGWSNESAFLTREAASVTIYFNRRPGCGGGDTNPGTQQCWSPDIASANTCPRRSTPARTPWPWPCAKRSRGHRSRMCDLLRGSGGWRGPSSGSRTGTTWTRQITRLTWSASHTCWHLSVTPPSGEPWTTTRPGQPVAGSYSLVIPALRNASGTRGTRPTSGSW